jgi:cytidylate kinase
MENNNQPLLICVGRQIGSGGRVIAQRLAEEFGCRFMDSEILNLAAKDSGFSEKFFKQNDEHKGFFRTLLNSHGRSFSMGNFYNSEFSEESLFQFQSEAIIKAAREGSCVFVGRCADYVLRDFGNTVNIFISAPMSFRIEQIMNKQHLDPEAARKFIEQKESKRAAYYNYYTGKKWGAAESYDLCIDTSILGIMETEKLIADFIRKKFEI